MLLAHGHEKAKRAAHLSERQTIIYTVSGRVQDNAGYFLCMDYMHQISSNFHPVASWESEAGLYLALKSLWCNFRENTVRECLIHVVMMRLHKIIHVVGLSFNLSKRGENTTVEEGIPGVGRWYVWGSEQDSRDFRGYMVHRREGGSFDYTLPVFVPVFVLLCYLETLSSERTRS